MLRRPGVPGAVVGPGLALGLMLGLLLGLILGLMPGAAAQPDRVGSRSVPARSAVGHAAGLAPKKAVIKRKVIGRSVRGRKIRAWRLGEKGRKKVVLISTMHGNERDTIEILRALRDGPPIKGVDLWVVPNYNPDGFARGTRRNARGVDLNRNFPNNWAPLSGNYYSGPRPRSEPETRAVMGFLRRLEPDRVISFHQPLHGVDTDTKDRRFARRLAGHLRLPHKSFRCGGVCHGTMTGWFNNNFAGAALTVEYGARPTRHRMRVQAPRQVLRAIGARRSRR